MDLNYIEKCQFDKSRIPFCGHILDKEDIRPNPDKMQEIVSIPRPKTFINSELSLEPLIITNLSKT